LSIPLCAQDPGAKTATADPKAYELLKGAQSARETFPANFTGVVPLLRSASMFSNLDGREAQWVTDVIRR
jgi:hypothetical protein